MDKLTSLHATPKAWLLNSVLAPHTEAFAARLEQGRYAANTASKYLYGISHLARWMTQCGLPVRLLDENGRHWVTFSNSFRPGEESKTSIALSRRRGQ